MMDEKICEHATKMSEYLGERLRALQDRHKCIGYVAGKGLLWAVEMVRDKETREPIIKEDRYASHRGDLNQYPSIIVYKKCLEKNVYQTGGYSVNSLRIGPPLTINEEQIDQAMDAFDYAFTAIDSMI